VWQPQVRRTWGWFESHSPLSERLPAKSTIAKPTLRFGLTPPHVHGVAAPVEGALVGVLGLSAGAFLHETADIANRLVQSQLRKTSIARRVLWAVFHALCLAPALHARQSRWLLPGPPAHNLSGFPEEREDLRFLCYRLSPLAADFVTGCPSADVAVGAECSEILFRRLPAGRL